MSESVRKAVLMGRRTFQVGRESCPKLANAERREGGNMATCETCGNDYDKSFQVVVSGKAHTFDSFECAIHALAPTCKHCGTRIVGHGLENDGTYYCCDHCAQAEGVTALRDRL
jgi:hypothetical protein